MALLVRDRGFLPEDWRHGYLPLAALSDNPGGSGVDLPDPDLSATEWRRLRGLLPGLGLVRLGARHFGDLAALDLAREIRAQGYRGRLRIHGAVLARDLTMIRRAGIDEVELTPEQARLQPAEHWHYRSDWLPDARGQGAGASGLL